MSQITKRQQGGFAISLILVAIVLLAVLAAMTSISSNVNVSGPMLDKMVTELVSQGQLIRQRINQCVLEYPAGDNGTTFNISYPAGAVATSVYSLTCPGAPAGSQDLWSGVDGVFLPKVPHTDFNEWQYVNDVNGIKITIQTTNATGRAVVLQRAANKFRADEASFAVDTLTYWIKH